MSEAEEIVVEDVQQDNNEVVELEVSNEQEAQEAQKEQPKQEETKKPFDPKTDKVEFSTPEQQEKFNYVYKQTKMSDQRNQMLTELLQEQQRQLDELKGRFQQTDSAEAERVLIYKIKAARDAGDDLAEIAATKEMVEFLADRKISDRGKPQPQVQYKQQVDNSEQYVESLRREVDSAGNVVRPWLYEDHPEFNSALNSLQNIAQRYVGDPNAVQKSLADLDSEMRAKMSQKKNPPNNPNTPNPLQGGNLTNVKPRSTIKMTRAELDIAKKLGVDPKRYAAQRDAEAAKNKRS